MSYEIMKSLSYKNGKVFTRQSSNNVTPKDFSSVEHTYFTKLIHEQGKDYLEKLILFAYAYEGTIKIPSDCNKVLKKIKFIGDLLRNQNKFLEYSKKLDLAFDKGLEAKSQKEKDYCNEQYKNIRKEFINYTNAFYVEQNKKFERNILYER